MSASTTSWMSEITITSSMAATRGRMFLPFAEAGATMCEYVPARPATRAAIGSASMLSRCAASASSTFSTPSSDAAASAAGRASLPATSIVTGPSAFAAVSALAVASTESWPPATSAIMRTAIR